MPEFSRIPTLGRTPQPTDVQMIHPAAAGRIVAFLLSMSRSMHGAALAACLVAALVPLPPGGTSAAADGETPVVAAARRVCVMCFRS